MGELFKKHPKTSVYGGKYDFFLRPVLNELSATYFIIMNIASMPWRQTLNSVSTCSIILNTASMP